MTAQPIDANNNSISALRLKSGGAHSITAGASSARNTAAFDAQTKVISVYASVPVYLKMGHSDVTAASTDHYFPAGVYYDFAIEGNAGVHHTHLAVLRAGADDGTVYISEKE
ncbi:MAG: hypothetical protein ACLFR0_05455 [Alphaproteobacteria bacterium]